MSILKWLKKPYFFESDPKIHLQLSIAIGSFVFLFIYIFQPFGMAEVKNNLFFYSLGFGVVTFCVESFLFIVIPYFFKDYFKNEKWTIGKNILFLLILITLISTCNWLYNSSVQISENGFVLSLKDIFFYTFSIAIFPIFLYTFFSEKIYTTKREKASKKIIELKVSKKSDKLNTKLKTEIKILAENKKDSITFDIEKLIYITSQGNYASFFFKTKNGLEEKILRTTLNNITNDLFAYNTIKRCHKSYIINAKFINSISGNARGYYLESDLLSVKIPVSRNIKKAELKDLIK